MSFAYVITAFGADAEARAIADVGEKPDPAERALWGDPAQVAAGARRFFDAGVDDVVLLPSSRGDIAEFARAAGEVARIVAAGRMSATVSVGIAAAAGAGVAERVAPALEQAGFHALWVNDTPGTDALSMLAAAAAATERLVLATGVLPVDRRSTDEILDRVAQLGLPQDRLVLGIGSGARPAGALARVTEAAAALEVQSQARIVVGALGPRMRRLAVTASDGVLLSWLTPQVARSQAREAHELAPDAHAALYVRAATDPDAVARLLAEADRYAAYPAYAANFERLGIAAGETVLRPDDIADGLTAYRDAVDEVVLRAIVADDTVEAYLSFVDAAAAAL